MPVTYSSSIGSQIVISSGEPDTSDFYDLVNQTSNTTAAMGDLTGPPQDGTAVSALLDATAFGTDTLAVVEGQASIVDSGAATTTNLDLAALAAAQAPGDAAFASTTIGATFTGGGGSYIQIGHDYTWMQVEDGETSVVSASSLALVVIELDPDYFPTTWDLGEPETAAVEEDAPAPMPVAAPGDGCGCLDGGGIDPGIDLDGNLATFDLALLAAGENSYADLLVDAFAAEDAMSTVTASIVLAVD